MDWAIPSFPGEGSEEESAARWVAPICPTAFGSAQRSRPSSGRRWADMRRAISRQAAAVRATPMSPGVSVSPPLSPVSVVSDFLASEETRPRRSPGRRRLTTPFARLSTILSCRDLLPCAAVCHYLRIGAVNTMPSGQDDPDLLDSNSAVSNREVKQKWTTAE
jgi:hypothetical protein